MPITPLHLGILAPINHWFPGRVSNTSFILVTLLIDLQAILYFGFGLGSGENLHAPYSHSLLVTLGIAAWVALCGLCKPAWAAGAYLAGFSHILLDMLVHHDMQPLAPLVNGNPFYLEAMVSVSAALVPLLIWLIQQCVSDSLDWLVARWGELPPWKL